MIEFSFYVKDYLLKISPSPKHWHFHCVPWKKSSIPVGASIKTSRGRANHDSTFIVWLFTKTVHFYQVWTVRFHILSRGYSIPVFFHSSSYFLNPKVWHSAKSDWNFTALDHYQLKALKKKSNDPELWQVCDCSLCTTSALFESCEWQTFMVSAEAVGGGVFISFLI